MIVVLAISMLEISKLGLKVGPILKISPGRSFRSANAAAAQKCIVSRFPMS
jgi:hypothetical protein